VRTRHLIAHSTAVVLAVLAGGPPLAGQPPARFDLLVRGGLIVDGTGTAPRPGDVGFRAGRIAAVGALDAAAADTVIDAAGRLVAPGFIDVHTHADELADHPGAEHFLRMGVTTVVAGNCGSSALDVAGAFAAIEKAGVAPNFATLVGHNTVRTAVMGTAQRAPTREELERMQGFVTRAMDDGAVGLSTGLQYVPGTYAARDEIVALAKAAAARGGLYASHMRNEGTELLDAVAEALAVGEAAACPVQISHLKVDAPSRWGISAKALAMIDEARARGRQVAADQYVYDAASSSLGIRFPSWALEGGQAAIVARLDDPATWGRIKQEMRRLIRERGLENYGFARVANYEPDPSLNGLSIPEAADKLLQSRDLDAQQEVMRRMLRAGGASMVYQFMSEEDITRILKHPQVAIASDSGLNVLGKGVPHPRGYGNAARALGRYVREQHVIPVEEAVRKMTALPAEQFGFADRGRIAEGLAADLVVFDPTRVVDEATYPAPHRYATGFTDVVVNGVPVIRAGAATGARPGRVLRHRGARQPGPLAGLR
jgi:N-acyl-D-amino-acid deacylase